MLLRSIVVASWVLVVVGLTSCKVEAPITVQGNGSFSCTAIPQLASINPGDPLNIVITASGGTGTYTVNGQSGTFTNNFTLSKTYVNETTSNINVGDTIVITDTNGAQATCSFVVNVTTTTSTSRSVSLAASPSTSVAVGSPITLTATPVNFTSAPTSYVFTSNDSGVNVTSTGASAVVTVVDGLSHAVNISVVASNASESATSQIALTFSASPSLTCTLSHPAGTYNTNDLVTFSVSASTGETVVITQLLVSDGTLVTPGVSNPFTVRYSTTGTKTVYVRAQSLNGVLCNNGAQLVDTVSIGSAPVLSCNMITAPNAVYQNSFFDALIVPVNPGSGTVVLDTINISPSASGGFYVKSDRINASVVVTDADVFDFYNSYVFTLTARVKNLTTGATGTCTAQETIYRWY